MPVLSLPEVGSLSLRAARGAGFIWGMAEECGHAASWLAKHGFDWGAVVLDCLAAPAPPSIRPTARLWQTNGRCCGLHAGVTLADFATLAEGPGDKGVMLGQIARPLLLLPFVQRAARAQGRALAVVIDGGLWAHVSGDSVELENAAVPAVAEVMVTPSPLTTPRAPLALHQTTRVSPAVIARLDALALQMTVPSSAQSEKGAGASQSDAD